MLIMFNCDIALRERHLLTSVFCGERGKGPRSECSLMDNFDFTEAKIVHKHLIYLTTLIHKLNGLRRYSVGITPVEC